MNCELKEKISLSKKLHFVGIGGISMSSLAILAQKEGYIVSGSDRNESKLTQMCAESGIKVIIGHFAESANDCDALIYTAAMSMTSPELVRATERGIPVISRSDFLGYIMQSYMTRIGISGTHGKTTTTSMISHIFISAGTDPTVANGAVSPELNGALRIGSRDYFIYEACEYKDSFLSFYPSISVITNIELDHTDYYPSLDAVIASFGKSIENAHCTVVNADDKTALKAVKDYNGWLVGISLEDENACYYAKNLHYHNGCGVYTLCKEGHNLCEVKLSVIGKFNVYNSVCAAAVADICGIEPQIIGEALSTFVPAKRRFETKAKIGGITIADDYAHHPSEISATLEGLKNVGSKRVICVFQPHTYSRTHDLFENFVKSLSKADKVVLADIYAARETDTLGVSSEQLSERIENAVYFQSFEEITQYLAETAQSGDLIITMGAGDIYKVGEMLTEKLKEKESSGQ